MRSALSAVLCCYSVICEEAHVCNIAGNIHSLGLKCPVHLCSLQQLSDLKREGLSWLGFTGAYHYHVPIPCLWMCTMVFSTRFAGKSLLKLHSVC